MIALLPSNNLYGQRYVNIEIPTFKNIKDIQSFNDDEILKKIQFVQSISDVDLTKTTYCDIEYLFNIAAFTLIFNVGSTKAKCPTCHKEYDYNINIGDIDVIELDKKNLKRFLKYKKSKYNFRILTAQEVKDLRIKSFYSDDPDDEFNNLKVKKILGISHLNIPHSIYLSALNFEKINYHGMDYKTKVVCKNEECKTSFDFVFKIPISILDFDINKFMSGYLDISSYISFEDYLQMSLQDYNSLVSYLNKKLL